MNSPMSLRLSHLIRVYELASTVKNGNHWTTVNELTDQLPAIRPVTLAAAVSALISLGPFKGSKLLVEEDKGALIAGAIAFQLGLPIAMGRWYPYGDKLVPFGAVVVPIRMEYNSGYLMVNGLSSGDEISIVEDTLSTGGTIVSLVQAVNSVGAVVKDIRVVVEKLGFGGRDYVKSQTGIDVMAAIGIRISNDGVVSVTEVGQQPRE